MYIQQCWNNVIVTLQNNEIPELFWVTLQKNVTQLKKWGITLLCNITEKKVSLFRYIFLGITKIVKKIKSQQISIKTKENKLQLH